MKNLFSPPESEYPKIKVKLLIFEREFLDAHDNLWRLMHKDTDWHTLAIARAKANEMERKFWNFKKKTNHLPLGFVAGNN